MFEEERILKRPTTFHEQLDILIERGLIVENEERALAILQRVNYYRFTAYTLTFKENDKFFTGTTFEKIYDHYQFDTKFRNLLMEIIEYIEISFRTQISNRIALEYGNLGHENEKNFMDKDFHIKFMDELSRSIKKSQKELAIAHYRDKYDAKYSIWVVIEIMSFGMISKLYNNMPTGDQKYISRTYYKEVHYKDLKNWLEVLTIVRNRCAHYSRLFNYKIKNIKYHKDEIVELRKNLIFGIIYNSKYLVSDRSFWTNWVTNLQSLIDQYKDIVDIGRIGFPETWYSLLIDQHRKRK